MDFIKGLINAVAITGIIFCLAGASYHFKRSPLTSFFFFLFAMIQFILVYYLYNQEEE